MDSGSVDALFLAGQFDAGGRAEAEAVDPGVEVGRRPRSLPIWIAPTLLDWARISAVVSVSSPCSVSSWIVRSATWIWSGTLKPVVGVIRPCCSAPETVKALNVEPGS